MNIKIAYITMLLPVLVTTSGCGVYKKYQTPDTTAITAAYKEAREAQQPDSIGGLLWEEVFTDPTLTSLINRALESNTSMKNARSNIAIAQSKLLGASLKYLPSLTLTPNAASASYAGSDLNWTYSIPGAVSWEVDIFGKLTNGKRGAKEALLQSEEYAQAVRSQLIANVASTYYRIAAVKKQLRLYNTTAQLWSESVDIMKRLKEAGRTNEAAVVQMEANYNSVLAGIKDLQLTLINLNSAMSLLLNEMPREWDVQEDAEFSCPPVMVRGIPMSAIAFRPDVAAAEHNLASAFYNVNSAKAAFYPTITLSVQGGYTNLLGSFIKNPGDWFYQLAGQMTAPIFARGSLKSNLDAAKEMQQQALNNFEYAVLGAASEIHNNMAAYVTASEKSQYIARQVENLEKSVEYTTDLLLYSNGTYLEVITAQQNLLSAQMSLISNNLDRVSNFIKLYQSLGGGR